MTKADRLEAELARERKKMARMFTIEQVEEWWENAYNHYHPIGKALRDTKRGLAAYIRKDEG